MAEHPSVEQRRRELEQAADEIDERSKEFLSLLQGTTRPIPTPEIRRELGMSNHQVRYRREKLQDLGLIHVDDGTTDTDRTPPKVHQLTQRGRDILEGEYLESDELPRPGTFTEVVNRLQALEGRHADLEERFGALEEEIQTVRETMQELTSSIGERQTNVDDDLAELQETIDALEKRQRQLAQRVEQNAEEIDNADSGGGLFG